jgi:hypothetical protein
LINAAKRDGILFFIVLSALLSLLGIANFELIKVTTTDMWFVFISFILAFVLSDRTMGYFLQESERRVSIRFVSEDHKRRISLLYSWYFFGIMFGSCLAALLVVGLEYLILNILKEVTLYFIIGLSTVSSGLVLWNFERKLGKKARSWQR